MNIMEVPTLAVPEQPGEQYQDHFPQIVNTSESPSDSNWHLYQSRNTLSAHVLDLSRANKSYNA